MPPVKKEKLSWKELVEKNQELKLYKILGKAAEETEKIIVGKIRLFNKK